MLKYNIESNLNSEINNNYYIYGQNYSLSCTKLDIIEISKLDNKLFIDFFRGYIELNSKITLPNDNNNLITKNNLPNFIIFFRKSDKSLIDIFINYLNNIVNIKYSIYIQNIYYNKIKYNYQLIFDSYHVLNLLSKLYYPNIDINNIDEYLYNIYMTLSNYKYINYDSENDILNYTLPKCKIKLIDKSAIMPIKSNASNIGYDITIIKRYKTITNNIIIYDTGIQLIPNFGYYYEIIPKFNLISTGYILTNSIGIIDNIDLDKNKTLLVALTKIDKDMPDITLPFRCCQLLLKEHLHFELIRNN
jgi:dUTPase